MAQNQLAKHINVDQAMERLDNDQTLYNELLELFIKEPAFSSNQIIQLTKASKKTEALNKLHSLKGSSIFLGANQLHDYCVEAEKLLKQTPTTEKITAEFETLILKIEEEHQLVCQEIKKALLKLE